jgi:RNAse (barnase) inhibitor barstar
MASDNTTLESRLLQNGCVVLYHNPFLMEEHSGLLVASGWAFKEIYVGAHGTQDELYDQVAGSLSFPNYFGRNLDALRDCMSDLDFSETPRLALGLIRFHALAHRDPAFAHAVLDIFAEMERGCLMTGKRVMFMVQSDDPNLHFPEVGATPVLWNFEEWLDSKRKNKQ